MKKFVTFTAALAAVGTFAAVDAAQARDQIKIVGSSTVFPYTQAVAEEFSKKGNKAPVVESTGTGGGMKQFCGGIGTEFADITGASRSMKKSEHSDCAKNGVTDITEVLIGFDGLSIAHSIKGPDINLTKEQVFLALAAQVPQGDALVANPYKKWSDIDAKLPGVAIIAYGPPPTSGTRDAFVELAMHEGCMKLPYYKAKKEAMKEDKKGFEKLVKDTCSAMRQDGAFIEAGENDNLIVQKLEADANAVGIFGYSFLFENQDKLKAVKIGGVAPSMETIADASYTISRPLYFYVKNAHRKVIPGLDAFLAEYVSEGSFGPQGYLVERGLVTLADAKRKAIAEAALKGANMPAPTN